MTVGPGDAQRGDEMRLALRGLLGAALLQQALDPRHRRVEILALGRPSAPKKFRARRPARRRQGRNRRRRPAAARPCAAATALIRALATKLSPVSSGSARPSSPAEIASTPCGESSSRISASLPGLWVAITSLPVMLAVHAFNPCGLGAIVNHATAIFCRSTSRATPFFASAISARNSSCENGVFSAVPCTSMMRPSPVMTKLASVSASESSA